MLVSRFLQILMKLHSVFRLWDTWPIQRCPESLSLILQPEDPAGASMLLYLPIQKTGGLGTGRRKWNFKLARGLVCLTTVCYSSKKTLRSLLHLQKEMFNSAPVQTIYQLHVIKYNSTDLRPLVKDIKNHAQSCKHKFLWIIFLLKYVQEICI